MNKIVNTLLAEYHLLLLNNRLSSLQESEGVGTEIDSVVKKISAIKKDGVTFKKKGLLKAYLFSEVKSTPKLIKNGNIIVGVALHVGSKKISGVDSMPTYFTYIRYEGKDVFNITEIPTEFVTQIGNYPKEVKTINFQLGISPLLTHILIKEEI